MSQRMDERTVPQVVVDPHRVLESGVVHVPCYVVIQERLHTRRKKEKDQLRWQLVSDIASELVREELVQDCTFKKQRIGDLCHRLRSMEREI